MKDKTHYRKAFNSPYLSAADLVEPIVLNIERVVLEKDATNKTKEAFNTAYFVEKQIRPGEPLKPMILNVHNSEVIRDMCNSKFIDDWSGRIEVYVDRNVKFGRDTVEGLRLRVPPPVIDEDQFEELSKLAKEVEADIPALLKWGGCETLQQFPVKKFSNAIAMLKTKKTANEVS
jgi:hypothetical protein